MMRLAFRLWRTYGVPPMKALRVAWLLRHRPHRGLHELREHAPLLARQIVAYTWMGLGPQGGAGLGDVRDDDSWTLKGPKGDV